MERVERGSEEDRRNTIRRLWLHIPFPGFYCKGLCVDSCGPINMSDVERRMLIEAAGADVTTGPDLVCSLLVDGKCSAYNNRPAVCRLYGAVPEMTCTHGCTPPMSSAKGRELFRLILDVGMD